MILHLKPFSLLVLLFILRGGASFAPLLSRWRRRKGIEWTNNVLQPQTPWDSSLLSSSRRGTDNWFQEESPNDNETRDRRPYREPAVGRAERELQSMRPAAANDDESYYFYDDDDDDDLVEGDDNDDTAFVPLDRRPRNTPSSPGRPLRGDLDYYYDDPPLEFEEEQDAPLGNFWSNPDSSLDAGPLAPRRPRNNASITRSSSSGRQRRKTTTFRSGIPEPPPPVTDFYNRLFWYGFDPAEAQESPADKTMFGGTKGKFNGLAFMYDGGLTMPEEQRRRKPRSRKQEEDYYLDSNGEESEEDEDYYYRDYKDKYDYEDIGYSASPSVTPPYDSPSMRASSSTPVPPRPRTRRRQRRNQQRFVGLDDSDRPPSPPRRSQTASWFDAEMEEDEEDYGMEMNDSSSSRSSRNRARRHRSDPREEEEDEEKPFNPFEIFFGLNRENLSRQAEEYNRQMGLEPSSEGRPQRSRRQRRRPGFAYRYDAEEDDDPDSAPVAEFETVLEKDDGDDFIDVKASHSRRAAKKDESVQASADEPSRARRELTWEDRALAIERVPPADVPAWGPSGDLGIDARSHAMSEATQDILAAKRRVEAKEANVQKRREELSILKVDTELERKRLRQQRGDPRRIQQLMRELDAEVDDAARAFRSAQLQLKVAQDELEEVERRHWAVLSFYNQSQVENGIEEAFREFEESEPAVKRIREKWIEEERKREEEKLRAEETEADQEESEDVSP